MDRARLEFQDHGHVALSGSLLLDELGRITMKASPALGKALQDAAELPVKEIGPFHFDDAARGVALIAALARGQRANLLELEFVVGAFEVRAYIGGARVRMTLNPGDFDPDAAWEFLLRWDDAKLAALHA